MATYDIITKSGLETALTLVKTELNNKVDKDGNKVLSTNDYTNDEKNKLATIQENANYYEHPANYTALTSGLYKITTTKEGHVSAGVTVTKSDITALGIPEENTTYSAVNDTQNGLMTPTMLSKLNTIPESAQENVIEKVQLNSSNLTVTNKTVNIPLATTNNDGAMPKEYITKIDGLVSSGGEPNIIEKIYVNNVEQTPTSKAVYLSVITSDDVDNAIKAKGYQTASDVTTAITGYGYQTASQVTSAITSYGYQTADDVDSAVAAAVSGITSFSYEVVETLPGTGVKGKIYLIAHTHGIQDIYDEYIWVGSSYEKLGNTDINLENYVQSSTLANYVESDDLYEVKPAEITALWNSITVS